MLEFKVGYTLEYFESRSFRLVYQDNPKKIKLTDSYSTTSAVIDYEDLLGIDSFSIKVQNLQQDVLEFKLANNKPIYFFINKYAYSTIKQLIIDKELVEKEEVKKFGECLRRLSNNTGSLGYIIQLSSSQIEKQKLKAQEIINANIDK